MMMFLRRFSQANRVLFVFGLAAAGWLGTVIAALNGLGGYALLGLTAVGMVTCFVVSWLIRWSIKAPVEATAMAVMGIAKGDLGTKIPSPGRDELSWLRAELDSMRRKLREIVVNVNETVGSVAAASQQIATGNSQLCSSTENQAAALEETASTMNQIAESVRHHAESVREVSAEMNDARGVAERGGVIMTDVARRMRDIEQSATRMSEIIGVIDGIAFQTNILALNAAVEAARAGEQGRGFAVVAAEVRTLAHRSSDAAREIRQLIDDSSTKVNAGCVQVEDAGATMQELLGRVARVTALVVDMDASGQSQRASIDQVHAAIAQIDDVTQQNAALVEQVASAAQSLSGQSEHLLNSVSKFKV